MTDPIAPETADPLEAEVEMPAENRAAVVKTTHEVEADDMFGSTT